MKMVSGLTYAYFMVCPRKMWYSNHNINLENENENVQIGKLIDETSYGKEYKHILIDDYANIDFFKDKTVYEVKKSSKHIESAEAQLKYYLYILHIKNVEGITGELRIPKENKTQKIMLTSDDIEEIENNLITIQRIFNSDVPPKCDQKKICKSCAYFELCFI